MDDEIGKRMEVNKGRYIVGEEGPELLDLGPAGMGRVRPLAEEAAMRRDGEVLADALTRLHEEVSESEYRERLYRGVKAAVETLPADQQEAFKRALAAEVRRLTEEN